MRTITLELLRHGPSHNQLLSPLTPYMALCGNHGAVTLHVPFEHKQFLHRLSALQYSQSDEARGFQLQDTAREIGEILARIPGLTAEANKPYPNGRELTHLRLIISASELALLPFELAMAPSGCPGAGQHLVLQPQSPLCVTREVRRAPDQPGPMTAKFRILFIAASPPGTGDIPFEANLFVLRKAIVPWVRHYAPDNMAMLRDRIEEHLVVLSAASIKEIEKACATGTFTHVHILAHGVNRPGASDDGFCLALHDSVDPSGTDYVSGTRLATALRANLRPFDGEDRRRASPASMPRVVCEAADPVEGKRLACPSMVSLASCNSGDVGSVVGAGASIAHALHEAGIPMVIAGQFPLSFGGAVHLTDVLFQGLLWGEDPRWLFHDLRRRLYTRFPKTHDWASLTTYVALPTDFHRTMEDLQVQRTVQSIDAAMSHADTATTAALSGTTNTAKVQLWLGSVRGRMKAAMQRLETLIQNMPSQRPRICGLLGSGRKREAEIVYSLWKLKDPPQDKEELRVEMVDLLVQARDRYDESFCLNRSNSWALVQQVALSCVLRSLHTENQGELFRIALNPRLALTDQWTTAYVLSMKDLLSEVPRDRIWARGNLIELSILANEIWPDFRDVAPNLEDVVRESIKDLIRLSSPYGFEVYSTRRQILRYVNWYPEISPLTEKTVYLAEMCADLLPTEGDLCFKG